MNTDRLTPTQIVLAAGQILTLSSPCGIKEVYVVTTDYDQDNKLVNCKMCALYKAFDLCGHTNCGKNHLIKINNYGRD